MIVTQEKAGQEVDLLKNVLKKLADQLNLDLTAPFLDSDETWDYLRELRSLEEAFMLSR